MTVTLEPIPVQVRHSWHGFSGLTWRPVYSGLINKTFCVEDAQGAPKAIVQRLHSIFDSRVNLDIEAVTTHLAGKGVITPRLIPTDEGDLWIEEESHVWRALSHIPGFTYEKVNDRKMAFEAGKLVGGFHHALNDFEYRYHSSFESAHNTSAHLDRLRQALKEHVTHPLYHEVLPATDDLLNAAERLPKLDNLSSRHAHGDLKISNLLFNEEGGGHCLIDLDTLGQMIWPFEMGDALRSWCNPSKEDQRPARLKLDLFEGALTGYASANALVSAEERESLVSGLIQICLELSARFLSDALNESYFAWDSTRYSSHGAHNLARAQAMWELYHSVNKQRRDAEHIVSSRMK